MAGRDNDGDTEKNHQRSRAKGRKTKQPVKLSRCHRNVYEEEEREFCQQEEDSYHFAESQNKDHPSTEKTHSNITIKQIKWDKRMRLTITKDFRKERKQSLSSRTLAKDDHPAQRTFTCIICQQAFLQASECNDHMYTHINKPPSPEDGAKTVSNGVSEGEDKVSDMDSKVGVEETEKRKNKASRKRKAENSCPECGILFTDASSLKTHVEQIHDILEAEKEQKCKVCGKICTCVRDLNRHRRFNHAGINSFECPVCSLFFPTPSSLSLHKRNHMGHRPFNCAYTGCNRTFPDQGSLNQHKRTHSEIRPYVCSHCGKAFKMQNHLREHIRLHTGERPFVCEFCGAGFAQSNGLKSHAKQHALDRDNQCDVCQKAFSHPQFLALHMKVHSGEKPYTCELCERTFRTACNLGAHRKLKHESMNHKGLKEFTCDVCGASFSQACNLGIHKKKKHSDAPVSLEKKYVCDICDAKFSEPCNLGAHKKIKHTEESSDGRNIFDCDICGAKFYRACNLSGHKRRKHGDTGDIKESDKLFACQLCHVRCSTFENLQEHHCKIHFSMPSSLTEEKSAVRITSNNATPQQFTSLSLDTQMQSNASLESDQGIAQSNPSSSFSESDHKIEYPRDTLLVVKPETVSVQNLLLSQSVQDSPGTVRLQQSNADSASLGDSSEKVSTVQPVSTFKSRPDSSSTSRLHCFPNPVVDGELASGPLMLGKTGLDQHHEMLLGDRFLQDNFTGK